MIKMFFLIAVLFLINSISAQNKTLTIYYSDSTRIVNFSNVDSMVIFICGASKVNYGGKAYNTVLIGNQCWLKENLNIGTRRDGGVYQSKDGTIEKWCYDNSEDSCTKYGGLYHWNEAMQYSETVGAQGICPISWHIPTAAEYQTLATNIDNESNSLKAIGQGTGSGMGTDVTGFSGLLAGGKWYDNSGFVAKGGWGNFWISQVGYSSIYSYTMRLESNNNTIFIENGTREEWGLSVRCIKD